MARPKKQGLEYFPLDVTMDDKVQLIEAKHGIIGFGILIKMYQKIYLEGYYYKWEEEQQLLFSNRVSVNRNLVIDVINDCLKWGLFNKEMYEKYRILTSKGIQERYVQATYKRTRIEMDTRYLLIDVSDRKNIVLIQVSDVKNSDTYNIDTSESTQSKVKESKVKESKVYIQQQKGTEQENEPLNNNDFKKVVDIYNNNIHPITPLEGEILSEWLGKVETNVIVEAIRESVKSGVRNIKYIEKILQSWYSNGLTTKEAVIAHLRDYQDKKNKGKVVPIKGGESIENYRGDSEEQRLLEEGIGIRL